MLKNSLFRPFAAVIVLLSFENSQSSLVEKLPTRSSTYGDSVFSRSMASLPSHYIAKAYHWDNQQKKYVPSKTILTKEQANALYDFDDSPISLADEYAIDDLIRESEEENSVIRTFFQNSYKGRDIADMSVTTALLLLHAMDPQEKLQKQLCICERGISVIIRRFGFGSFTYNSVINALKKHSEIYKSQKEESELQESMAAQEIQNPDYQYIFNYDGQNNALINRPFDVKLYEGQGRYANLLLHRLRDKSSWIMMMWYCNLSYKNFVEILEHDIFVAENKTNKALANILREIRDKVLSSREAYITIPKEFFKQESFTQRLIRYEKDAVNKRKMKHLLYGVGNSGSATQLSSPIHMPIGQPVSDVNLVQDTYNRAFSDQEGTFKAEHDKFYTGDRQESRVIAFGDSQKVVTEGDDELPAFGTSLANTMSAYHVHQKVVPGLRDKIIGFYGTNTEKPWNDLGNMKNEVQKATESQQRFLGVNLFSFPKTVTETVIEEGNPVQTERNTYQGFSSIYGPVIFLYGKPVTENNQVEIDYIQVKLRKDREAARREVEPSFLDSEKVSRTKKFTTKEKDKSYYSDWLISGRSDLQQQSNEPKTQEVK